MSIGEAFAYDLLRPGQVEFAQRVNEAYISGEILVTTATSGFGKTAAILSGTLTAAEETDSRVDALHRVCVSEAGGRT